MRKAILPSFAELALSGIIIAFLIFGTLEPQARGVSKICILVTLYYWAILALFGLLIPRVKHKFTFGFESKPQDNRLGYPIRISCRSQGGFICNHPIFVKARIVNAGSRAEKGELHDVKKLFRENFREFNIIWPCSKPYRQKNRGSLKDRLDIGGVEINIKKCSGRSAIVFNLPGKHPCNLVYKTATGVATTSPPPSEEDKPEAFLFISPPEALYTIRINNIIYSLLLIILSFGLWNTLNRLW